VTEGLLGPFGWFGGPNATMWPELLAAGAVGAYVAARRQWLAAESDRAARAEQAREEATRQIAADPELTGVRIIILTTFEADEYVFEAIRAGASGFLVKDTEPEDLISAIRVVARGDALLSPSVTRTLISSIAGRGPARPVDASALSVLTDREREVLARVAAGMSNDEIGAALFMSPLTAKTHVNRMMTKLGARDRAQLVVIAYETGLVRPGLS
jgi:DNA-binding NarL/FixJ family response regulator